MKITQVVVEPTPEDCPAPLYDHSMLSAINTCPKWGIIRYGLSLVMPGAGRAMALEAGQASHNAFAAIRLFQLMNYSDHPHRDFLAQVVGETAFGAEGWRRVLQASLVGVNEREHIINMAHQAVFESGFYDDPDDKRRTMANIADSVVAYIDRWDMRRYPIWYSDETRTAKVGIEVEFDLLIQMHIEGNSTPLVVRYGGRIDGLHWDGPEKKQLLIHENKTGSVIDDAWLAQWQLSHQITGYCIGVSAITGTDVNRAHVIGMKIPVGRDTGSAIRQETVNRTPQMFADFFLWVAHTVGDLVLPYRESPIHAPMYTHSCNRYFRACALLPLCTTDEDEQKKILEEMVKSEWSPIDGKAVG